MLSNVVRVRDIDPQSLEGPYSLKLARAISGRYLGNGAMYTGVHAAPRDTRGFFLTAIIDETSPDQNDERQKLMVQGGTQYGCSARLCPFCVFSGLEHYRNLGLEEIVDLFRLALYLHGKSHDHTLDQRELRLKFTDNGEPLLSPLLPQALESILHLFGREEKILRLKISSILKDSPLTRVTFREVLAWQARNLSRASIHLQVSWSSCKKRTIPPVEVVEMIRDWTRANPADRVCIAPGLIRGFRRYELEAFCAALEPVRGRCFIRPSVIKPTTKKQAEMILTHAEMAEVNNWLGRMGFSVDPLPQHSTYTEQMKGAGTLSHLPNGKFYYPSTYRVWKYTDNGVDPNIPIK